MRLYPLVILFLAALVTSCGRASSFDDEETVDKGEGGAGGQGTEEQETEREPVTPTELPPLYNPPGAPGVTQTVELPRDRVVTAPFDVTCVVEPPDDARAYPIDRSSYRVAIVNDEGIQLFIVEPSEFDSNLEFTVEVPIERLESGEYTVQCLAGDSGVPVKWGKDESKLYVDHGPEVQFLEPGDGGAVSPAQLQDFSVRIDPVQLFAGDDDAEITGRVRMWIDGVEFELEEEPNDAGVFSARLDLSDERAFHDGLPDGTTELVVRAKNRRGTVAETTFLIFVDGEGPSIEILSPEDQAVVGSTTTVELIIQDDSRVNWGTLEVLVASQQLQFDENSALWEREGDVVRFRLNSSDYRAERILTLNFSAQDDLGNGSEIAEVAFWLDEEPPTLSLDAPNVRAINGANECSHAFDPLGAAVSHGDSVSQFAFFRALVWDETNDVGGGELHHADVDQATIHLWLSDASSPLVIDESGDGTCDSISSAAQPQLVALDPIPPQGTPFYGDGTSDGSTPDMGGICDYAASPSEAPGMLCPGQFSDLYYVPGRFTEGLSPVVFGFGVRDDGPTCTGTSIEVPAMIGTDYQGWVCAALEGADKVANGGVSAPIAFCLDNVNVLGLPDCWGAGSGAAPDCAENCTPRIFAEDGRFVLDSSAL